jgi:predicted ATPase
METTGQATIPRIVITGGPASGKSTTIDYLKSHHNNLAYVEEAATLVLADGYPLPTADKPWTQSWQNELQIAIAIKQTELEFIAGNHASATAKSAIVQDRGLLDGAAYLSGGIREFEQLTGIGFREALDRYHTVIYLGWLGSGTYETKSNPMRFEAADRAQLIEARTMEIWSEHPHFVMVTEQVNRTQRVSEIIQSLILRK